MTPGISHDPASRRFEIVVDGERGTLDYALEGRTMTIAHVKVPEAIAHRGIAGGLVRSALETARASGWRVVAQCPYAAFYLREHAAEWADIATPA